jgi:hypothetical protein
MQVHSGVLLPSALVLLLSGPTAEAAARRCAWGAGAAVSQPPQSLLPGAPNLTCTPTSVIGAGSLEIDVLPSTETHEAYYDAQMFTYHQGQRTIPAGRANPGLVKVALLPLAGGDGRSNFSVALQYIEKAGQLGVDLAVLPENFAQKHVGKTGDMDPPPQTVSQPGGIIVQVAALCRKYNMNAVAPIREKRGTETLNTAVVLNRSGAVIGRYSKLFPVLGPPDTLGPGGREEQVNPSEHGVVAVDMDFGRISLAICVSIRHDHTLLFSFVSSAPQSRGCPSLPSCSST